MSRRQASNGICGIVCVASIFMCLELWVDRGRSPHQSHVGGGVAPALLPTPSGGAPQGGAGRAAAPPPNLSIGGM